MPSGHVEKKGKNWYVILELENEDGERNRRWISAKKELGLAKRPTKPQAEELLNKYLRDLHDGVYVEPSDITVKEYLLQWLEDYAKPNVKPTTYGTYKNAAEKHIIPALGKLQLSKLRKSKIKGFIATKQKEGARADNKDGKLSSSSVYNIFFVLKNMLKHAVEDELIRRNPAEGLSAPKKEKPEVKYWEQDQAKAFLKALREHKDGKNQKKKGHRLYALYLLALTTGMRRGELLGLKWENIDFKKNTIKVASSFVHTNEGDIMQESTKGGKSRIIEVPEGVMKALKQHKKQQAEMLIALKRPADNKSDEKEEWKNLVFTTTKGTPILPRNFERQLKSLIKKYKLPPLAPHGLRHTAATKMLEDGVGVKTVAYVLGHEDASVLLNIYTHVTPKMKTTAAESMSDLI